MSSEISKFCKNTENVKESRIKFAHLLLQVVAVDYFLI